LRGLTIIAGGAKRDRLFKAILYTVWLAAMLWIASRHVFWRDEVRAFSLALGGSNVVEMLRGVHGEGHPALWYLMLRGAHAIVPVREVLPIMGWLVAAASMAVLVFRSPFRLWLIALILFSRFGLLEYAVIARNYGIAMLFLFLLAWLYPRWRDRGPTIGLVLAFLCNTNVPAALLAAAFLLFWLIELIGEEGLKWGPKYRLFLLNTAIAAFGALLAFVTVFPTVHDAAQNPLPQGIGFGLIFESLAAPALAFGDMIPMAIPDSALISSLFGLVMFAALLGLARRPAALLSTMAAMGALQLFFNIVYPSYYRHQALFLVYLIVMYWLVALGRGGRWPSPRSEDDGLDSLRIGSLALVVLLGLQVMSCITLAGFELGRYPFSRSRDLAQLIRREHLTDAVILSNPDYMAEPLPYYLPNPIYLMREQKYGHVVRFSAHVRRELSLDDFVDEGHEIQRRTGRPVVIMLEKRLSPNTPAFRILDVHVWHFNGTPRQVRRFLASTRRLARFGDAITQETYDVYLLNPPAKRSA
jgi:hypothetical protein